MLESVQVQSARDCCLNDSEGCTVWKASYILPLEIMFNPSPIPPREKKKKKSKGESRERGGRNRTEAGEWEGKKLNQNSFNKAPLWLALKTHQPPLLSLSTNAHRSWEKNKLLEHPQGETNLSFTWFNVLTSMDALPVRGFSDLCVDE